MTRRVLHLLWDGNLGGVQRYILKVVGSSHWENTEHAICFFTSGGDVIQNDDLNGIQFWSLDLTRGWDLFAARKNLDRVIKEFNPGAIHCHCDTPAFSLQIKRFSNLKLIYTEHGDTIMRRDRVWLMNLLWRYSGKSWDAILSNSHFVQKDFLRRFPALESRCHVFHNPLIESWNGDIAQINHEGPRIGVFGRLVWQKGIDRGLEVMKYVNEQIPSAKMFIYGVGELEPELKQKSKELGLSECVEFCGYTPDPLANMAAMDCTIVPSRTEPFGLVALEAQCTGTPVVGFRQSGVAEVIKEGETGLLVEQGELKAMAGAVVSILINEDLKGSMGKAARERAETVFTLKNHVHALEEVYTTSKAIST